jgi:hypothetical protein
MGRRKRDGNHSPHPQNNLKQGSEGNEENGYLFLDYKKTKINDTKETNNAQKTSSKKKSCK